MRELGLFAWRREGSGETLEPLLVPKGCWFIRKLGTDFWKGQGMIGEGLLLFTLERADYRQRRLAFTMRVVEHWHKFPREVVSATSGWTGLQATCSSWCSCPLVGAWTRQPLRVPPNLTILWFWVCEMYAYETISSLPKCLQVIWIACSELLCSQGAFPQGFLLITINHVPADV